MFNFFIPWNREKADKELYDFLEEIVESNKPDPDIGILGDYGNYQFCYRISDCRLLLITVWIWISFTSMSDASAAPPVRAGCLPGCHGGAYFSAQRRPENSTGWRTTPAVQSPSHKLGASYTTGTVEQWHLVFWLLLNSCLSVDFVSYDKS